MVKGASIAIIHNQVCRLWEHEHITLGLYTASDLESQNPDQPLYQRYFMRGVSHFLGLDVHDVGHRGTILEPGMVLTCEPGIYITNEALGIRLENTIMVTEGEPIDLMAHIPIEPDEIEALMQNTPSC
jgi:Xaa-Pro aminopeptidase